MGADAETRKLSLMVGGERARIGELHWVPPLGTRGTPRKRRRKNCRNQRGRGYQENTAYRIMARIIALGR